MVLRLKLNPKKIVISSPINNVTVKKTTRWGKTTLFAINKRKVNAATNAHGCESKLLRPKLTQGVKEKMKNRMPKKLLKLTFNIFMEAKLI